MYTKSQIMQKGHYKTGEIAKMLGISIPTAIKYCDIGVIKASKNQHGHRRIIRNENKRLNWYVS